MRALARQGAIFLLAVQFLTRLPVPSSVPFSPARSVASVGYYPLVGVLVGCIAAAVLVAGAALWSMPVAVILSLAATLLVTGALHEDGLADAADGLGGGATRERALEIMRDSRIGSFGAAALVVALGLKVAVLAGFEPHTAAAALVLGHAASRWMAVEVIATAAYARVEGTKFATPEVRPAGRVLAALTVAVVAAVTAPVLGGSVLAGLVACVACAWIFRQRFVARLGGYTGDCLGGVQQCGELGLYLGVLAWP